MKEQIVGSCVSVKVSNETNSLTNNPSLELRTGYRSGYYNCNESYTVLCIIKVLC